MQLKLSRAPHDVAPLKPGDLVDEIDAAKKLDIAVGTLRNWRSQKTGPRFHKIGKRAVRYHVADLIAFIGSGTDATK